MEQILYKLMIVICLCSLIKREVYFYVCVYVVIYTIKEICHCIADLAFTKSKIYHSLNMTLHIEFKIYVEVLT